MPKDPFTEVRLLESPELEEVDLLPDIHDALTKGRRPSVLQVVLLRDGLLIGTEVFLPGNYTVGSGSDCDLQLDDASVGALHARLRFHDGKAAVQAAGGPLFVNGMPVTSATLRPVDDLQLGAFSLKVRVVAQAVPRAEPAVPRAGSRGAAASRTELVEVTVPSARVRPLAPLDPARGTADRRALFCELSWGDARQQARSFPPGKPIVADLDDAAPMPLWGFPLDGPMTLAEARDGGFRVFIPPAAAVERRDARGDFQPCAARGHVDLKHGEAVRFTSDQTALVAFVAEPAAMPFVNPLRSLPLLSLGLTAGLLLAFAGFVSLAPTDDEAEFTLKQMPRPDVKLAFLEKPKPKPPPTKQPHAERNAGPEAKTPDKHRAPPARPPKLPFGGQSIAAALGATLPQILPMAPGRHGGKTSVAATRALPMGGSGGASFGLGAGATQGLGQFGDRIGAMGVGKIGRGAVAGTVARVSPRALGTSGSIDRDAVAKVINGHLAEISSCYERGLLHAPSLAGKVVLEWNISTAGVVTVAKTKSSSLKSSVVESCILSALKTWRFPAAKGGGVVISYPFLFNSVGS